MRVDYAELTRTISALLSGETDDVAIMATLACEVHHSDSRFDWTGFYRVAGREMLKIGPYQGTHGCLSIAFGRGVCGMAALSGEIQLVPDVASYAGHIACSASTRSELVLPVRNREGHLIAVFDIDSDEPAAFTREDADQLAAILDASFSSSAR